MKLRVLVLVVFCLFFSVGATFRKGRSKNVTSTCGYVNQASFRFMGYKHNKWHLTYKITKYSKKMKDGDVKKILDKAFAAWSKVTNLKFTRKLKNYRGHVDIEIRFNQQDGRGRNLAYAGYDKIRFDESEPWSKDRGHGVINFYAVAVHEIGHSLGLQHSQYKESIMYHTYDRKVYRLHRDDIRGIQELYGSKSKR